MNMYIEARDNEQIYKATIASNPTIKRKHNKKWLESRRQWLALEDEEGYLTVQVHLIGSVNTLHYFNTLHYCYVQFHSNKYNIYG